MFACFGYGVSKYPSDAEKENGKMIILSYKTLLTDVDLLQKQVVPCCVLFNDLSHVYTHPKIYNILTDSEWYYLISSFIYKFIHVQSLHIYLFPCRECCYVQNTALKCVISEMFK